MLEKVLLSVALCFCMAEQIASLDNGLALTPPMGWLSWERFRCNTDCDRYPETCISDHLIREISDKMVEDGYLEAGYEYVIIDDCWLLPDRDENGRLQPDPTRFPNGIKGLADYVHSKGLKFGIYEDIGTNTCAGFPGLLGHYEVDAQTFASWEVDYLKIDGCYLDPQEFGQGYPEFGRYLNQTGRPIVYSCEWPLYQENSGMEPDFAAIAATCNLWRNWWDIDDHWNSLMPIVDHFAERQDVYAQWAGPGHWNDPDMLIIGNYGLSEQQARVQMAIWAVLSAPLLMSHDPRNVRSEFRDILLNRNAIGINQDLLGVGGKRIYSEDGIEIFTKEILPNVNGKNSLAVAVINRRIDGAPHRVTISLESLMLDDGNYAVSEAFDGWGDSLTPDTPLEADVPPTGGILLRVVRQES